MILNNNSSIFIKRIKNTCYFKKTKIIQILILYNTIQFYT